MLTKLLPDQISKMWDLLRYCIEQSMPVNIEMHPNKMDKLLMSALNGKLEVWAAYRKEEDKVVFEGILVTRFVYDDATDSKNMLIYALYGYEKISEDTYLNGLKTIIKYAHANNCYQIIAYTDRENVVELVNQLGGDTSFTMVSFNVKDLIKEI